MSRSKKPNLVVYGTSKTDPKVWKKIGVAWTKCKDGVKYISIALDFIPNTSVMTVWSEKVEPSEPGEEEKTDEEAK